MSIVKDKTRAVLRCHFRNNSLSNQEVASECGVDEAFVKHVLAENAAPSLYKEKKTKPQLVMDFYRRNPSASIQEIEDATGVNRHYAFRILASRGF